MTRWEQGMNGRWWQALFTVLSSNLKILLAPIRCLKWSLPIGGRHSLSIIRVFSKNQRNLLLLTKQQGLLRLRTAKIFHNSPKRLPNLRPRNQRRKYLQRRKLSWINFLQMKRTLKLDLHMPNGYLNKLSAMKMLSKRAWRSWPKTKSGMIVLPTIC